MNDLAQAGLQRALELTVEMIDAATADNWALVAELDIQRHVHLQQAPADRAGPHHRETLLALQTHNRALLERANLVREAVEQQLTQHQYNHRALRTYIKSSASR